MAKRSVPLIKVYRHLESGPVVLLTTSRNGVPDVMPMAWHTVMEFTPPLVGMIVSNQNYSFENLRKTKECVINVPTADLVKKVVSCGKTTGEEVDKFKRFGLTPEPAKEVQAPLIKECYASFEAKVVDTRFVEKYNFFVVEVVKAWVDPKVKEPKTLHHRGSGNFSVPGRTVHVPFWSP